MLNMKQSTRDKLVAILIVLFVLGVIALAVRLIGAQNPQSQTMPLFRVNSAITNGVAPGYAPSKGSGLTLNLGPGTANCGAGVIASYGGGTLTMANGASNYVFLNTASSCVPASNTSGFTSSTIPIAVVTTSGGVITGITDDRTPFQAAPAAGVTSVFGRSGAVVAATNDYNEAQISFS